TDPASVLLDLRNNRARKEQIDALREVWPDVYDKVKSEIVEQMAHSRPSIAQRTRLDLLFDFGDGFDRALSPRLAAALDGLQQQGDAGAPPDAGPQGAGPRMPTRRSQPSVQGASAFAALSRGAAGNAV